MLQTQQGLLPFAEINSYMEKEPYMIGSLFRPSWKTWINLKTVQLLHYH